MIAGLGSTQLESHGDLGMSASTQLLSPLPTRAELSSVQMLTEGSVFQGKRGASEPLAMPRPLGRGGR